jgi:hypothetical protein
MLHIVCEVVYTVASSDPSLCSWSIRFQVVWTGFLRVLLGSPRFRLPYRDGGWLRVLLSGGTTYLGYLQVVTMAGFLACYLCDLLSRREDRDRSISLPFTLSSKVVYSLDTTGVRSDNHLQCLVIVTPQVFIWVH